MTNKIKQLSEQTINKIAAGEVIDRPASVVKELLENALDAGATHIIIEIQNDGKNLISVCDNGHGIAKDELLLAIKRHATSKLNEEDINSILYFGFRGEALPSITSVSKVKIVSKTADSIPYTIEITDGIPSSVEPAARQGTGTTIEVKDLFCYTPARLKFLKSSTNERSTIIDLIYRFSLANNVVAFKLIYNNKQILDIKPDADRDQRVIKILGKDFFNNAGIVALNKAGITITGYATFASYNYATSMHHYIFINGRSVKDKLLQTAVKIAYQGLIPHGRYPGVILFIAIDTYQVDVNVHPAKAEVRFQAPNTIKDIIIHAIRTAINDTKHFISKQTMNDAIIVNHSDLYKTKPISKDAILAQHRVTNYISTHATTNYIPKTIDARQSLAINTINTLNTHRLIENTEIKEATMPPLGFAQFQLHKKYIVAYNQNGLVIVDQHAAHERIMLERFKKALQGANIKSQRLLIPADVQLDTRLLNGIIAIQEQLKLLGIDMAIKNNNTVAILSMPIDIIVEDIAVFIKDIAEQIAHLESDAKEIINHEFEKVLSTFACHHSIRSGRTMSISEMNGLLRDIEDSDFAMQCNHGRPTIKLFSIKELDGMFER